jgi:hypothetical protein
MKNLKNPTTEKRVGLPGKEIQWEQGCRKIRQNNKRQ